MLTYSYCRVLRFVCWIFLVVKHFHLLRPISMIIVAAYFLFLFLCCVVVAPYYYIVTYSGLHISKKTNKQAFELPCRRPTVLKMSLRVWSQYCSKQQSVWCCLLAYETSNVGQTRMRKSQIWILQRHAIFSLPLQQLPSAALKQVTKQEHKIAVCYQPGRVLILSCASVLHLGAHV